MQIVRKSVGPMYLDHLYNDPDNVRWIVCWTFLSDDCEWIPCERIFSTESEAREFFKTLPD